MNNYIYGKVKRKQKLFRIIETEIEIYDTSQLKNSSVEYNPATLIENEEFYRIDYFSQESYCPDFLKQDFDSVNYKQIQKPDLKKLSFICTIQNEIYFFQLINSNYYISKKWFSIDELEIENDKPIITINPFADAIYDNKNDILYFKKLNIVQKIFKGMDQLYKEATDEETSEFLKNDFLEVNESFDSTKVSVPNRKRIALVNETLSLLTVEEKHAIYNYSSGYGRVIFKDGKFKIETDDDLKFVLWGIEQRFYTTPIGNEKRVANSIMSL